GVPPRRSGVSPHHRLARHLGEGIADLARTRRLSMLKVYSSFNSICTQKVFITLAEKGLAYDTHNVNLFTNEQFKPDYLKINPKGVVPALDHDGRIIIESSLICEYLDESFAH